MKLIRDSHCDIYNILLINRNDYFKIYSSFYTILKLL